MSTIRFNSSICFVKKSASCTNIYAKNSLKFNVIEGIGHGFVIVTSICTMVIGIIAVS